MVVEDISVSKKPTGSCKVCGEPYGNLVLDKTGQVVGNFSDCSCHDKELEAELAAEKQGFGFAFVV